MNSGGFNFASGFGDCVGGDFGGVEKLLVGGELFDVAQELPQVIQQVFNMRVRGLESIYKG